jgi:hypothetical protein
MDLPRTLRGCADAWWRLDLGLDLDNASDLDPGRLDCCLPRLPGIAPGPIGPAWTAWTAWTLPRIVAWTCLDCTQTACLDAAPGPCLDLDLKTCPCTACLRLRTCPWTLREPCLRRPAACLDLLTLAWCCLDRT